MTLDEFRAAVNAMNSRACECGCGGLVWQRRGVIARFLPGHHMTPRMIGYTVAPEGCWNWNGSRNNKGYAHLGRGGKNMGAYRYFYIQHKGAIPDGLEIDHLCRNRNCVNPDHLEAVTHSQNVRRGRKSKLTHEQAAFIARQSRKQIHVLSVIFNLSRNQIYRIMKGQSWSA